MTPSTPPVVLAIHDLSGFGRGSLTTVITVLGAMGIQVCPMPSALLSSNTSFPDFTFLDLSQQMRGFISHWHKLGLKFDVIYSGFLGSPTQCDLVKRCIELFSHENTLTVIDPVLGDNGALYPTMDNCMVEQMRGLIASAQIITPNLTEASLLLNEPCPTAGIKRGTVIEWLKRLSSMGPDTVVITSAVLSGEAQGASSVVAHSNNACWQVKCDYIPAHYPGTGDIFASVLTGALIWKEQLPVAIARAMRFVANGIEISERAGQQPRNGVLLEPILASISGPLSRTQSQPLIAEQE